MRVVRERRELQTLADGERAAGRRIALVPTMGALHAGHLSLVGVARARADRVWLSIFVNPAQFDDPADLASYPRAFEADLEASRAAGVDVVFAPAAPELYPEGHQTWVEVRDLTRSLCGESRPGHFSGVTTVVTKLLLAAKPHVAVFGEKDYQQLAVIRRLVLDLGFDVEVANGPTVREPDGLALSSRNKNLSPEGRREAPALHRALVAADRAFAAGERSAAALLHVAIAEIEKSELSEIDYAELCDPETLVPVPHVLDGPALLALAVLLPGKDGEDSRVRLIDNCILGRSEAPS